MNTANGSPQLKIGLSLPCCEIQELQSLYDIPEEFELLELSGELIGDAAQLMQSHPVLREFEFFNFRNLLPAKLTSQLTSAGGTIIAEYKKQLRELLSQAENCHAECVSIDPDWEALVQEPQRADVFNDVLQATAGDRRYYNTDLAIAVRFPGSGQLPLTESVKLLHRLTGYRVKLVLDINPHELLNCQVNWQELLRHFRFDTSCVRFCYQSELGNKLLYKHIEPIVNVLKSWRREMNIYISPSGRADLNELAQMVRNINSGSEIL